MTMMTGGIGSDTQSASPEVQSLVERVKHDVESKLNAKFIKFEVHSYKTQVVAGTNYFVKVHTGDDRYMHLRIYRDLQRNVSLHSVQDNKSEDDELSYF